ncbi:MAG: HNH endonuclease [Anaerolineales bacterium]|uniref:HNH endonuclease n=1 Tax=Promineifilum sp. TaxID=2664178 RepID=UPI001D23AF42|nr:HNH endonuclease [Anaerolineales bacterium]
MSLQRGMNFRAGDNYSIILMSQRTNAPYRDRIEDDGTTLIYEGHDEPKRNDLPDPKKVDQPAVTNRGTLTENGKFARAAEQFKRREGRAERVRVYEKIRTGIWSYNGLFHLVDSWVETDGRREVFKFKLVAVDDETFTSDQQSGDLESTRLIPSAVKVAVWRRDGGKCVRCGATDNLHFDHVIPYAKGGTSLRAENIQLLCARHNLAKRDRIE